VAPVFTLHSVRDINGVAVVFGEDIETVKPREQGVIMLSDADKRL